MLFKLFYFFIKKFFIKIRDTMCTFKSCFVSFVVLLFLLYVVKQKLKTIKTQGFIKSYYLSSEVFLICEYEYLWIYAKDFNCFKFFKQKISYFFKGYEFKGYEVLVFKSLEFFMIGRSPIIVVLRTTMKKKKKRLVARKKLFNTVLFYLPPS